jgi:hypothetical protein
MNRQSVTYRYMRQAATSLVAVLMLSGLWTTSETRAQDITHDWKLHNAGRVIQLVHNRGYLNKLGTDYGGLLNTEFPPNSFQEHAGGFGWFIGGVPQGGAYAGDTLVSVGKAHGSSEEFLGYSSQPFDTVWVAERGDALDLPYQVPYPDSTYVPSEDSEGYVPVSDQDFVTRYNDYNALTRSRNARHRPLNIDVIHTSYAWGSPPLHEMIFVNYAVVVKEHDINSVYLASFVDGLVGRRTGAGFTFGNDDYSTYNEEYNMGIVHDGEGGPDGGKYSPMGVMVVPPDRKPVDELTWTWLHTGRAAPPTDPERYEQMKSGIVMDDQVYASGTRYFQSFGPYSLQEKDTLRFSLGIVLGTSLDSLLINAETARFALERDFGLPKAPPQPQLEAERFSGGVELDWSGSKEKVENYTDTNRRDSVEQPFEGYRVWKSTQTAQGPWTLLGVYDIDKNEYPPNGGLRRTYTDDGLVNNVEYFYSVTAFSKPDSTINWPSQQTSISANAVKVVPGSGPKTGLDSVAVVPNPYRGDIRYQDYDPPWEKPPGTRERWLEQDRRLQFINLPEQARIKIYTLDGVHVQTLRHSSTRRGFEDWDMISRAGQAIASGIYLYTVENLANGNATTGKFVVIK